MTTISRVLLNWEMRRGWTLTTCGETRRKSLDETGCDMSVELKLVVFSLWVVQKMRALMYSPDKEVLLWRHKQAASRGSRRHLWQPQNNAW